MQYTRGRRRRSHRELRRNLAHRRNRESVLRPDRSSVLESTSLFGRVAFRQATIDTIQLNPNFNSFGQPENQNYVVGLTRALSPRWLVDARVSFVRESTPNQTGREGTDIDPFRDFGISGFNLDDPLLRGIPSAGITGYMGTGETFANPRLLYENPDRQLDTVLNLSGIQSDSAPRFPPPHGLLLGQRPQPGIVQFHRTAERQRVRGLPARPARPDRPHPERGRASLRQPAVHA